MRKFLVSLLIAMAICSGQVPAQAACSWTTISNGGTADATQVMNNFDCLAPKSSPIFTGNVGIGTTSPGANVEIQDAIGSNLLRLNGPNTTNNGPYITFARNSSVIGYVGSYAGIQIGNSSDTELWSNTDLILTSNTGDIRFNSNTGVTERMRITSAGNVGIGTTSPARPLDVAGTIRQTGCTTAGTLAVNSSGDIICSSDARLKNVLSAYRSGLEAVMKLEPALFTYKATAENPRETFIHAGFIAQNVKAAIPQASALQRDGYYSLDTTAILAASVNAIKELKTRLETKDKQINLLNARLDKIERRERQFAVRTASK